MERNTFRRASATLFAAALLLAACGDDDAQTDAAGASTTTTADRVAVTTTIGIEGDDAEPADEEAVIAVTASGGEVEGGGRQSVALGETVTIRVTSDVDDHIHLHGYDVMVDVTAGEPAVLTFEATIPGVFEVELEDSRIQLLELEIS